MADEIEVIKDDYDNDDVAVLDQEPPMSERDKFLFDNLVRTINAHKKANNNSNNAPPQLPKIGEEGAGEKKLEYAKKLEEAIQSITPKSSIENNLDLENMELPLPTPTPDKDVVVEKSIVLIPLKSEEEERDKTEELAKDKVVPVRPKKEYPCKMCDYKGTKTNHVARHMRKHHMDMLDNTDKVVPYQKTPVQESKTRDENLVDQILTENSLAKVSMSETISLDVLDGIGNLDVKTEALEEEDCFKDVVMTNVEQGPKEDAKGSFDVDIMALMKKAVGHVEELEEGVQVKIDSFIKCGECSFSTKNKVVMREHEKSIHSGEVRFQCSNCEYKSYFKFNVASHQKGVHDAEVCRIITVGCEKCVEGEKHLKCEVTAHDTKVEALETKLQQNETKLEQNETIAQQIETIAQQIETKIENVETRIGNGAGAITNEKTLVTEQGDEEKKECGECDYKTTKNKNLTAHKISVHKKEVRYACEGCDYKSFHKNRVTSHIANLHKNETLRCVGIGCESCEDGEKHETCDFIKKPFEGFQCKLCPYKTLQKAYFINHEKLGHENVLSCTSCDFQTLKKDSLVKHTEAKHLNLVKYYCSACDHKSYYSHHVGQHIASNHKQSDAKVKRIDCSECDANTVHARCFSERSKDAKSSPSSKEPQEHSCNDCDYKSFKKMYLESHIRLNHGEDALKDGDVLQCKTCEFQTKKTQCMTIHRQSIHDKIKRFECSECGYKSYFGTGMEGHIKRNHSTPGARSLSIGCLLCKESKTHTKCKVKTQEFKASARFLKSEQNGTRRKFQLQQSEEYSCDQCDYKSLKRTYYQVHKKLNHGSERVPSEEILHCSLCEFETKTLQCLTIHKKSMHDKEVRFNCSECVYQTFFHHCVVEHLKRNHKKVETARWLLVGCHLCETKSEHNKCVRQQKDSKALVKVHKKQALKDILSLQHKEDMKDDVKIKSGRKRKKKKMLRKNPLSLENEEKPRKQKGRLGPKARKIDSERIYSCKTCPFETKIKWYLNGHTKIVHGENVDLSKILTCNQCEFETVNQMSMRSHKRAQHLGEKRFCCSTCGLKSFYGHHIRAHITTNHRKEGGQLMRLTCAKCRSNVEHKECKEETKNEEDAKPENDQNGDFRCEKCGYIGTTSQSIRRHKEAVHDGILRFSCSICPSVKAYDRQTIKIHMSKWHADNPEAKIKNLNCTQCKNNVEHDCQQEAEPKTDSGPLINCEKCTFTTNSTKSMTRHTESVHDGVRKFACSACDYKSYDKNAVKHHITSKHRGEKDVKIKNLNCGSCEAGVEHEHGRAPNSRIFQTRNFDCNYCDFKSKGTQGAVVAHMKKEHPLERLFQCPECPYKCNWLPNLKTHKRAMHDREEFKCDQCGWATVWKPPFFEHMREKHGIFQRNSKYRSDLELSESMCEKCGFAATSKRSMRLHKKSDCQMTEDLRFNRAQGRRGREEAGGWKRLRGPCCEKYADNPKALAEHLAAVHERKYRTCVQCGFQASSLYQLNTHKYETHKAGQTNCPECGLKFKNRFNLLIHTKLKHAKGGFLCDLCDFKAESSETLRNHRDSTHLGIVFKCDLCTYEGLGKARLHCHKMRSHAEQYLRCDQCDFSGSNYLVLKSHKAFNHLPKSHQDLVSEVESKSGIQTLDIRRHHLEVKPEVKIFDIQSQHIQNKPDFQTLDLQSQYPHLQIKSASPEEENQAANPKIEMGVDPKDYPHLNINFLPS